LFSILKRQPAELTYGPKTTIRAEQTPIGPHRFGHSRPAASRPAPIVYGKPFIVVEDEQKNTFVFQAGAWVPHTASIAECRQTCQVKELPQRVNKMIRYEVRCPVGSR
jgi:hypothetical protein